MSHSNESSEAANNKVIDLPTLADAQDGSEVLFAVAQILENKHGKEYGYAKLLRQNAHAIRDLTDSCQPWAVANETNADIAQMWDHLSPRDNGVVVENHHRELARRLELKL